MHINNSFSQIKHFSTLFKVVGAAARLISCKPTRCLGPTVALMEKCTFLGNRTERTKGEPAVRCVQTRPVAWRKDQLIETVGTLETLTPPQQQAPRLSRWASQCSCTRRTWTWGPETQLQTHRSCVNYPNLLTSVKLIIPCSYYRWFIKNFAQIAKPLCQLIKKKC